MNIEKYTETIKACRFCFMCRHLSPIGNVTFREADTPRVRAILLDRVLRDPAQMANEDYWASLISELTDEFRRPIDPPPFPVELISEP